jgi:copper resistance protein B
LSHAGRAELVVVCAAVAVALASGLAVGAASPDALAAAPFGSPVDDQRIYVHGLLEQLEARLDGNDSFRWQGEAWLGTDSNRLWIRSEGLLTDGRSQDGQQELLYARPVSTYFDLQAGIRYDLDSYAGRAWAALGVEGLAAYFFRTSATVYASDTGQWAAKLSGFYDELLTQHLILEPQAELNLYTSADPARRIGAGLSAIDAGLRLRYEISRKLAPYLGVSYHRQFGQTARYAAAGDAINDTCLLIGVRTWF